MVRVVIVLSAFAVGCQSKSESKDLPAASSWNAPEAVASQPGGTAQGANPHGGGAGGAMANPHGGGAGGAMANPHGGGAGGAMANPHGGGAGTDPHAGLDMGNPNDPHGGMGADPAMAAMSPPDPNRTVDKTKYLRGVIDATEALRSKVQPGAILFLAVRPVDATTGDILGTPIAVERVNITKLPVAFELTGANAMVAGTDFSGHVLIDARVDRDGEARTREPGDVIGSVRAEIPAKGLRLVLDAELR